MSEKGLHDYSWANKQMKAGHAVSRNLWGESEFLIIRGGRVISNPDGVVGTIGLKEFRSLDHYCKFATVETRQDWTDQLTLYDSECVCEVGWNPSMQDLSANDWYLYEVAGDAPVV